MAGLLHADDVYADGEVLARVAVAFADPAVEAVYGDLVYVAREDTGRDPRLALRGVSAGAAASGLDAAASDAVSAPRA